MDNSRLKIVKPCQESWAELTGSEREKFCQKCQKTVHDISALTESEAETLVDESATRPCVRYIADESGAPIFRGSAAWLKLAAAGAFIAVSGAGCHSPQSANPAMGELVGTPNVAICPPARVGKVAAPYSASIGRVAPRKPSKP